MISTVTEPKASAESPLERKNAKLLLGFSALRNGRQKRMLELNVAVRLERVWVVTGPVFAGVVKKLASGVDVPTAFFRIILDEENGQPRVLAFIAPQTVTGHEPLAQFLTSVREIERQTGLDFYPELPKEVQDRMESAKADRLW